MPQALRYNPSNFEVSLAAPATTPLARTTKRNPYVGERKSNPSFLNGVPEMLILQLLSRRAMHGYELVQAIKAASRHEFEFGEGCVYPILHRLEADGLLRSAKNSESGRVRLVYQATASGKTRLARSIGSWQRVVTAVNDALYGGEYGDAPLAR